MSYDIEGDIHKLRRKEQSPDLNVVVFMITMIGVVSPNANGKYIDIIQKGTLHPINFV